MAKTHPFCLLREVCKIFIKLAIEEPGENWENVEYRWSKYDPAVPGWSLPQTWTTADEENNGDGMICQSYNTLT